MGKYIKCLQCPETFSISGSLKLKKYCSAVCRRKYWRQNTDKGKQQITRDTTSKAAFKAREKYKNSDKYKQARKIYVNSEGGKAVYRRAAKKHNKKYPEERKARNKVTNALKLGLLVKSDICSKCNKYSDKIQAHHHNGYSDFNALDIIWLCPVCHHEEHELTCNCIRGRKLRGKLNF